VPVLVLALLFATEGYDIASGCGSVDPTDSANFVAGQLVNDTASIVDVDSCNGGFCGNSARSAHLSVNGRFKVNVGCGESRTRMTSWQVSREGELLGYLAVGTGKGRYNVVYGVSRLSPNRQTPTVPTSPGVLAR
jgi:hypothetical protein